MDKNLDLVKIADQKLKVEKYKTKPSEELVEGVIQDIEASLVEHTKIARENYILAFWDTGRIIREAENNNKINVSALVNRLVLDNRITGRQMGVTNIWFALKTFDAFPKFEKLYDTEYGQNISISKLKKMLTTPKAKTEKSVKEIAADIVARLGAEKARKLADEIVKECDRVEE